MFRVFTITLFVSAGLAEPARADYWISLNNGTYLYFPDEFIWFVLVVGAIIIMAVIASAMSSGNSSSDIVLSGTETADHFDNEAARLRALSRKLDAETDLAESVIKAKRTRAELDDIEEMYRDSKSRRR